MREQRLFREGLCSPCMSRQVGGDTGKPPPGGKGHWTREAAGYCSFLLLKNPDEAEKHDAQLVAAGDDRRRVERKTKRKLAATKEYINQNRRELWVYLYHRELRYEEKVFVDSERKFCALLCLNGEIGQSSP